MLTACLLAGDPIRPALPRNALVKMSLSERVQSQLEGIRARAEDAAQLQWPPLSPDEAELQTTFSELQAVEESQAAIAEAARKIFDPTKIDLQAVQATGNGLRQLSDQPNGAAELEAMQRAGDELSTIATVTRTGDGGSDFLVTSSLVAAACLSGYALRAPIAHALDNLARQAVQSLYPAGTFDEASSDRSLQEDDDQDVGRSRSNESFWQIAQSTRVGKWLSE